MLMKLKLPFDITIHVYHILYLLCIKTMDFSRVYHKFRQIWKLKVQRGRNVNAHGIEYFQNPQLGAFGGYW